MGLNLNGADDAYAYNKKLTSQIIFRLLLVTRTTNFHRASWALNIGAITDSSSSSSHRSDHGLTCGALPSFSRIPDSSANPEVVVDSVRRIHNPHRIQHDLPWAIEFPCYLLATRVTKPLAGMNGDVWH